METLKQEVEQPAENPFVRILELIDKEYYAFLNNLEELENDVQGNIKKSALLKDFFELLEVSPEKLKEIIDEKITGAVEKINILSRKKETEISFDNSLVDILENSILAGLNTANKVVNSIREGKIQKIDDLTESRKQLLEIFKKSLANVPYYLNEICEDEKKLEDELTNQEGYLKNFKKYFNVTEEGKTIFPTGGKKIAYIKMFDEITPENVRGLVENPSIDKKIINTEMLISETEGLKEEQKIEVTEEPQVKERLLRIQNANDWIEQIDNKVENPNLSKNNIEIFSDEQLQTEDIEFIIATKNQLDADEEKFVKIIILNKEHWSEFMSLIGRDDSNKQFTGRAEENPITPTNIKQFLVLPSREVFSGDTQYRQIYLSSNKVQEIFNQPEGAETLYRGIYLRNILSHEMAHLYQFSPTEIQNILQSNDTEYHEKFNKFLETREFLSCMFGLFNLKKNNQLVYEAYIDACQELIKSKNGNGYVIEQAKRSLDSASLLNSFPGQDITKMFKKFHKICQSDNNLQKDDLQKMILSIRSNETSFDQLREFATKE